MAVVFVVAAAVGGIVWFAERGHGSNSTRSRVAGFETVAFTVSGRGGRCALLADTPAQRGLGLMSRRDLAGYNGMIFSWPAPTTEEFYMSDTVIPLSIAWFDQSGRFVSETDMAPCPPQTTCPLFSAEGPYTVAIEVPQGGLGRLGIGPGSTIALGGPCH